MSTSSNLVFNQTIGSHYLPSCNSNKNNSQAFDAISIKNTSIKSIKIPLIRQSSHSLVQSNSNSNINNNNSSSIESDLTELSWLTNVGQVSNKSSNSSILGCSAEAAASPSSNILNRKHENCQFASNNSNLLKCANRKISSTYKKMNTSKTKNKLVNNFDDSDYLNMASLSPTSSSTSYSSSLSSNSSLTSNDQNSTTSKSPSSSYFLNDNNNNNNNNNVVETAIKQNDIVINKNIKIESIEQESFRFGENNVNMLFKNNCGLNKPPLTLSCLIFMALQESKEKCLPVREIYEWIEENFPFYKNTSNGGWKSSIRHNLSFSKCFKKMERGEIGVINKIKLINANKQQQKNQLNNEYSHLGANGRKRRAPNSTGTCWKVNMECKSYLIQTLKKSSFWFHNSTFYPNLNKYILSYINGSSTQQNEQEKDQVKQIVQDSEEINLNKKRNNKKRFNGKKIKLECSSQLLNEQKDQENQEQDEDDYLFKQNNLFDFVQRQHEQLCKNKNEQYDEEDLLTVNENHIKLSTDILLKHLFNNFDSNDLAAAIALVAAHNQSPTQIIDNNKQENKLDLSFSSSTSSSSCDYPIFSSSSSSSSSSSCSSSNSSNSSLGAKIKAIKNEFLNKRKNSTESLQLDPTEDIKKKENIENELDSVNSLNLNSDLEMEVASTLVDMRWFANSRKQ